MQCRILLPAAIGAMILSSSSLAIVEVIFSDIKGQPTAVVPLGPNLGVAAEFISFDRPFRSHNGQRWMIQGNTDLAATEDRVVVVFNGASASTVLREGLQAPWTVNAETMGIFGTLTGINDGGDFAFTNNTSATTADDYAVGFDASAASYSVLGQEGQTIPGSANTFGATQDSPHVLNDGTFAFYSTANAGGARLMRGGAALAQATVTSPTNQAAGGTETYSSFTAGSYGASADGAHYIVRGNLNGDTLVDEVVAVDNAVVLREGLLIAGMSNPIGAAFGFVLMMSNGDWLVRGSTTPDDEDYVVRNGTLIARSGAPIFTGATENWGEASFAATFFWMQGNNDGDYVVGGVTSNANTNANAVLVLNGTTVLVREGDAVDLNDNGLPDDDAFISVINNDDGFLTNDALYFTADLRNAALTAIGQAFLRLDLGGGTTCPANIVNSGTSANRVDVDDMLAVISSWGNCPAPPAPCPANIVNTGTSANRVDVDDLLAVISQWGACP